MRSAIQSARASNTRILLSERGGLTLAVGQTVATWTILARPTGRDANGKRPNPKSHVIGDVTTMSIDEARAKAIEIKALVRSGRDPTAERRSRRARL